MKADSDELSKTAVYTQQPIEEYKGNPFIEALPPILSVPEAIDAMTVMPGYSENERELDAHYRFHCVQRLFRYFQPLDTHIDIEQRVSRAIRQGYINRNPLTAQYVQKIRQLDEAIVKRSLDSAAANAVKHTAAGLPSLGCPASEKRRRLNGYCRSILNILCIPGITASHFA